MGREKQKKLSMKNETNIDIRSAMKKAGLTYKRLSEIMSISEATLYRLLRSELNDADRNNLIRIIISYESGKNAARLGENRSEENLLDDWRIKVIEMSDQELYEELSRYRSAIAKQKAKADPGEHIECRDLPDHIKIIANEYRNRMRRKTKCGSSRKY